MKRLELEHIIRAGSGITQDSDLIVVGSQSILGQFPAAPPELLASMEADVFPKNQPDLSLLIDGAIGELSLFHQTYGYYAHGVDPETAVLPEGWKDRLIPISNENTGGSTGWCLEVHDLALSKLVAARDKDVAFVRSLLCRGMVTLDLLRRRLDQTQIDEERRSWILNWLQHVE